MSASQLSPDTPAEICPRFRGVSHQLAFLVALPLAIAFAFVPDTAAGRASAAVYGAGVAFMFGASGAYHRIRWSWPRWQSLARRVDHAGIFLLIAASYTPAGLLILHGGWRYAVLGIVWIGAAVAIVVKLCWLDAPKWVVAGIAVALGWVAVLVLPQMWASVGAVGCALIVAGGVAYTVGAHRLRARAARSAAGRLRLPRGLPRARRRSRWRSSTSRSRSSCCRGTDSNRGAARPGRRLGLPRCWNASRTSRSGAAGGSSGSGSRCSCSAPVSPSSVSPTAGSSRSRSRATRPTRRTRRP